jgi:hypothetical protein
MGNMMAVLSSQHQTVRQGTWLVHALHMHVLGKLSFAQVASGTGPTC